MMHVQMGVQRIRGSVGVDRRMLTATAFMGQGPWTHQLLLSRSAPVGVVYITIIVVWTWYIIIVLLGHCGLPGFQSQLMLEIYGLLTDCMLPGRRGIM